MHSSKATAVPEKLRFDALSIAAGLGVAGSVKGITISPLGFELSRSIFAHQWASPRKDHRVTLSVVNQDASIANTSSVVAGLGKNQKVNLNMKNVSGGTVTIDGTSIFRIELPGFLPAGTTVSEVSVPGLSASLDSVLTLTYSGSDMAWQDHKVITVVLDIPPVPVTPAIRNEAKVVVEHICGTTFNTHLMTSAVAEFNLVVQSVPISWKVNITQFKLVDGVSNGISYKTNAYMPPTADAIVPLIVDGTEDTTVTAVQSLDDDDVIWTLGFQYKTVPTNSNEVIQQFNAVWFSIQKGRNKSIYGNYVYPPSPLANNVSTATYPVSESLEIT